MSSSSVYFSWLAPPPDTIFGEFLGYRISYKPRTNPEDNKEIYLRDPTVTVSTNILLFVLMFVSKCFITNNTDWNVTSFNLIIFSFSFFSIKIHIENWRRRCLHIWSVHNCRQWTLVDGNGTNLCRNINYVPIK